MAWQAKTAAVAALLIAEASAGDVIPPPWGLLAFVAMVVALWRFYDGLWRTVVSGLVGGALAGLLVLGPGFRLAMRAVAIMDPFHPEEFTIGGTFFIVVGVGVVLGGVNGVLANVVRKGLEIHSAVLAGTLLAVIVMVNLAFFTGDISRELFELGITPWINIPLFSVVALGYGIAAMAIADLAERVMFERRGVEKEKVPA